MTRQYKLLRGMTIATAVLTAILVSIIAFWLTYPYNPIEQTPNPFEIVFPATRVVPQGGILVYEFDYVKHNDIAPTISRRFVDGLIFNAGFASPTVVGEGSGHAHVEVDVPHTLPPGTYNLEITATYQVNPIRKVIITNNTERFTVIDGD